MAVNKRYVGLAKSYTMYEGMTCDQIMKSVIAFKSALIKPK